MSGVRRAWLDVSPGERRGTVTLDGRPERLWIEREGEPARARLGERRLVRLGARSPDRREAFADLGDDLSGVVRLPPAATAAEGALIEAEVSAEAYADKAARLTYLGPSGGGAPGLLAPGPTLQQRLAAAADGAAIEGGSAAREAADLAEEAALTIRQALKGGVALTIEPTRALTAIDVDFAAPGERGGRVQDANLRAIRHAARLLRLKALGGTVAIDLIGFPKAVGLIKAEAERAFAADGPDVSVLAPNRLGVMMIALPRRERPITEQLLGPDGKPSARTLAQRLVRALEREGRADPGARLWAVCPPEVAAALRPLAAELGPRFGVREDPAARAEPPHILRA